MCTVRDNTKWEGSDLQKRFDRIIKKYDKPKKYRGSRLPIDQIPDIDLVDCFQCHCKLERAMKFEVREQYFCTMECVNKYRSETEDDTPPPTPKHMNIFRWGVLAY